MPSESCVCVYTNTHTHKLHTCAFLYSHGKSQTTDCNRQMEMRLKHVETRASGYFQIQKQEPKFLLNYIGLLDKNSKNKTIKKIFFLRLQYIYFQNDKISKLFILLFTKSNTTYVPYVKLIKNLRFQKNLFFHVVLRFYNVNYDLLS